MDYKAPKIESDSTKHFKTMSSNKSNLPYIHKIWSTDEISLPNANKECLLSVPSSISKDSTSQFNVDGEPNHKLIPFLIDAAGRYICMHKNIDK